MSALHRTTSALYVLRIVPGSPTVLTDLEPHFHFVTGLLDNFVVLKPGVPLELIVWVSLLLHRH